MNTQSSRASEIAAYSATELMHDGRPVEIRALRPNDEADLLAAVEKTSAQSLYRRFFGVRRGFSEQEISFFVNVDFVNHVALVAVSNEGGRSEIVGGGRFIVVSPSRAEMAFAVIDRCQGQGIGSALLRHLVRIAQENSIRELVADVLPDNKPMLKLFEKNGFSAKREGEVVHVVKPL